MSPRVDLAFPFSGPWRVQNSPANRVPSHGSRLFATTYAIDFVPVGEDGRSAPFTLFSLLRPEPPDRFTGFGRTIVAPSSGRVTAVHDGEVDHPAYRGLPSVGYALTQGRRAAASGWLGLAGNVVVIELEPRVLVALCHLRMGSVSVSVGQPIERGEPLGQCGNSGNSTEPHVHLQAMDRSDAARATPLPISFGGVLPRTGEIVQA